MRPDRPVGPPENCWVRSTLTPRTRWGPRPEFSLEIGAAERPGQAMEEFSYFVPRDPQGAGGALETLQTPCSAVVLPPDGYHRHHHVPSRHGRAIT